MRTVICDYCNTASRLAKGDEIYPHRADLSRLKFWLCDNCGAYVGCHKNGDGTKPLGRLADAGLRAAKRNAHDAFDPIWREGEMSRGKAYSWLAEQLNVPKEDCHIGMFDIQQCMKVVRFCMLRRLKSKQC